MTASDIMKVIHQLRATNSVPEKVEILRQNPSPLLEKVLLATYNDMRSYWISPPELDVTMGRGGIERLWEFLDQLETRQISGNHAKDELRKLVACSDKDTAELICLIIGRDLKCGIGKSTINKAFPNLIPEFKLMACDTLNEKNEKKIVWPCIAQIKYDAARVAIVVEPHGVSYFTRNGRRYLVEQPLLDQAFMATMKKTSSGSCVLDGELFFVDKNGHMLDRATSNGLALKLIKGTLPGEARDRMRIVVWDVVTLQDFLEGESSVMYASRFKKASDIVRAMALETKFSGVVKLAETRQVINIEEAYQYANEAIAEGQEGVIIKEETGIWEAKRVSQCLKMKKYFECELEVIDVEEGTNSNKGSLGALVCQSADGLLKTNVGIGLDLPTRASIWADPSSIIGKIITVGFMEVTKARGAHTHSLNLPRIIETRFDKDEADTLQQIIDLSSRKID